MRRRVLPLLLILCGQTACASSVPIPFLLVTERVDGVVRDGLTGEPIAGAKVCIKFTAKETAFIESLVPDRFGYTNRLEGVGSGSTDAEGEFGVRGLIPHFSPIGWDKGWQRLLVEADGYGPLVAHKTVRRGEARVAILQGGPPEDREREARLEALQLFPSNRTGPYAVGTPASRMDGTCSE